MSVHSTDQIRVRLDVHQSSVTAAVLRGDGHGPEVVRMRSDLNAVAEEAQVGTHQGDAAHKGDPRLEYAARVHPNPRRQTEAAPRRTVERAVPNPRMSVWSPSNEPASPPEHEAPRASRAGRPESVDVTPTVPYHLRSVIFSASVQPSTVSLQKYTPDDTGRP